MTPPILTTHILGLLLVLLPFARSELFEEPNRVAKWILIGVMTISCLVLKLFDKKGPVSIAQLSFPVFLILCSATTSWLHPNSYRDVIFLVLVQFLALFWLGSSLYKTKHFIIFCSYAAFSLGLVCAWDGYRLLNGQSISLSFYGNGNLKAEALGFLSLLTLGGITLTDVRRLKKWGSLFLIVGFFEVVLLKCRSVIIALFLALAYCFWKKYGPTLKKSKLLVIMTLGLIGLLGTFGINKKESTQVRWNLLMNSVELLMQDPWIGIGQGRFEYAYLDKWKRVKNEWDTSKTYHFQSPHNDYLYLAIEHGIPLSLLVFLAFGVFLFKSRVFTANTGPPLLLAVLAVYFLAQMALQFPWSEPTAFYLGSLFSGSLSQFVPGRHRLGSPLLGSAITLFLLVSLAYKQAVFFQAAKIEKDRSSLRQDYEWACEKQPSLWRNCLMAARCSLWEGDLAKAGNTLEIVLKRDPNLYLAYRYLTFYHLRRGEHEKACRAFLKYSSVFGLDAPELSGMEHCFSKY